MTKKDYEKVARIIGKLTANNCESLTKQNLINPFNPQTYIHAVLSHFQPFWLHLEKIP